MGAARSYVGIDLGTTNSVAAIFDGATSAVVRNAQGTALTPSVVRIDGKGATTVGMRARRFLESDPDNTRGEFKRLLGTQAKLSFAAAKIERTPIELSAAVLDTLRRNVESQLGFAPTAAVISVPALFELPQTSATAEAARLAGFERVEMIQEPVASALAAGWNADSTATASESWLVYDLGGGTFDVSLLESREGLLRVAGHDGDNFLGGRDLDAALVDWALEQLSKEAGVELRRGDPRLASTVRKLRWACEEAKIELSQRDEVTIDLVGGIALDGDVIEVAVPVTRAVIDALVTPLVDRSVAICQRLLAAHGLAPSQLARVVLVGGPTAMPAVRKRLEERLKVPFAEGFDPMTLVAQGAALFGATVGLDARASSKGIASPVGSTTDAPRAWLQYPPVTADDAPFVVGKVLDAARFDAQSVVFARTDGAWTSTPEPLDPEGAFAVSLSLRPRTSNAFEVKVVRADGVSLAAQPKSFDVVHGVTLGEPPLSRSVGVARAEGDVRIFVERGAPLPARRTHTMKTVQAVAPGSGYLVRVPIVQGEYPIASLCRLVGMLEIPSAALTQTLPAGTTIEITLELDRAGRLRVSARIPSLDKAFDGAVQLSVPSADVRELPALVEAARKRLAEAHAGAFRRLDASTIARLGAVEPDWDALARDVSAAASGDADAAEKVRRLLIEVDGIISDAEAASAWPELLDEVAHDVSWAASWIGAHASPSEQRAFDETLRLLEKAKGARSPSEVARHRIVLRRFGWTAYYRSPSAWLEQFEGASSRASEATDFKKAHALVEEGRRAAMQDDRAALERITRALWALLPPHAEDRKRGLDSGVV